MNKTKSRIGILRQSIDGMKSFRRCPVTGGIQTRMTEAGFISACEKFMAAACKKRFTGGQGFMVRKNAWCRECLGKKRPEELKILTIDEIMGVDMDRVRETGDCEICGATWKKIFKNHGVMVCTPCSKLQADVSKRPELLIKELQRMHGDSIFKDHIPIPAEREDFSMLEVDTLNTANADLAEQLLEREREIEKLQSEIDRHHAEIEDMGPQVLESTTEVKQCNGDSSTDLVLLTKLLGDTELLANVNSLADRLREVA